MLDFFYNCDRKRTTITISLKSKLLRRNSEIQSFFSFHLIILAIKCLKNMAEKHGYCLVNKQVKLLLYTCLLMK